MDYPVKTQQQLKPLLVGFRKRAGKSQAEVAALLGISQQSYARIEANPTATNLGRLITILRLLDVEVVLAQKNDGTPAPVQSPKNPAPPKLVPPSGTKQSW
ncbi:helix-turn-helix transcriptional regulator [Herbaspirillum sp. alder98]|uniref:helix-turn-helix transcriptional regulator n=1 Tax=Herbaspirillum sp. alder98 TaxID=2913096 RepID=UPI001CD8FF6D|nr:helix-turn-helix transcriptional regulator [Herbaspirillum sp. alder98]MCA1323144.1 helix-turn-helix transcriptional regulator [Herbaspirillum sp. alder98]